MNLYAILSHVQTLLPNLVIFVVNGNNPQYAIFAADDYLQAIDELRTWSQPEPDGSGRWRLTINPEMMSQLGIVGWEVRR